MVPRRFSEEKLQRVKSEGTTLDRIWAHCVWGEDKMPLSEKELEIKDRLDTAFSLLTTFHSPEQAIPMLRSKYGISVAQAYRDIAAAKRLYGDITESSKEADRYILSEYAMRALQLATKEKDIKGMNMAIGNLIKLKRLDQTDNSVLTEEDMQDHTYTMILPGKNGEVMKIDLMDLEKVPTSDRNKFISFVNNDITDAEIIEIMGKGTDGH